ncbi:metal ABC transporter solute-binding protein, Zn/Mn family [Porphyromonas loveana]|uniref:metal ABC transporter solute-binding protein, Zn/Mn family n=3 Tax=Porphyromonas loveana TaxID=1884669 RepID=UPI0035A04B60
MIRTILLRLFSYKDSSTYRLLTVVLSIAAISTLAACKQHTDKRADRIVAVTIAPQRFFIEAIADSAVQVVPLVPAGSNPEEYDPSPSVMKQLADADAYFYIGGLGFEQRNLQAIRDNNPRLSIFEMGEALSHAAHEDHGEACTHDSHGHSGGHDPHYWTSIIGAKALGHAAYKALVELYPDQEHRWSEGYGRLEKRIDSVRAVIDNLFAGGRMDKAFVIYHPSLGYFAEEFGLRQIVIEQDGKEPSAAHLHQVIDQARADNVRIVFIQPEFETRQAEEVARAIGAEMIRINPLRGSWEEEILHIARSLVHGK